MLDTYSDGVNGFVVLLGHFAGMVWVHMCLYLKGSHHLGLTYETALSTTAIKTPSEGLSFGRMLFYCLSYVSRDLWLSTVKLFWQPVAAPHRTVFPLICHLSDCAFMMSCHFMFAFFQ